LISEELRVWYDDFELEIGQNLRDTIDLGIKLSRFGVVVLSPSFFKKPWPQYELDGLLNRDMAGELKILPIWHQVTQREIMSHSPSFATRFALKTIDSDIEKIAREIAKVSRKSKTTESHPNLKLVMAA
jgi:hypothetical protein